MAVCYRRPCAECGVYEQGLPPVVCPGCPAPGGPLGYFLSDQNKDKTQRKSFASSASHLTRHPAAGLLGTSICPNFCWRRRFCPSYITAIFICSKISHLIPCSPSMLNAKGHSTLNIEIQMERNNPGQDNLN